MHANPLTSQLSQVFEFHPHLKKSGVRVQIESGNAVLTGTVNSYYEKQIAQESLRDVPGIDSIDNSLEVLWQ